MSEVVKFLDSGGMSFLLMNCAVLTSNTLDQIFPYEKSVGCVRRRHIAK